MRLRRDSQATKILKSSPLVLLIENQNDDMSQYQGKFNQHFPTIQPLFIEIGMGKGDFIIGMAQKYPQYNFIGIEKYDTVLKVALKKVEASKLTNIRLMSADAKSLSQIFDCKEVDGIYLNFSDPWPKKRHYKRRLTYQSFLKEYQTVLNDSGYLYFKTDNRSLFEYSLQSLNAYPMVFDDICLDLHTDERFKEQIETEYERKFAALGFPIYYIKAHF